MDVSAKREPCFQPSATILGPRAILDCEKWHPAERHPTFAKVETDEHIWELAEYVRTLNQRLRTIFNKSIVKPDPSWHVRRVNPREPRKTTEFGTQD